MCDAGFNALRHNKIPINIFKKSKVYKMKYFPKAWLWIVASILTAGCNEVGNPNNLNRPDFDDDSNIQVPGNDQPGNDQPGNDQPGNDQPGDDQPGDDQPGGDQPGGDQPGDDQPGDDQPGDDQPGDDQPGDDQPGDVIPEVKPDDDSPITADVDGVQILPMTYAPYTTLQIAHRPRIGNSRYSAERVKELIASHDLLPSDKDKFEQYGLGIEDVEGEPWILREQLLRNTDPDISHKGQSIAYFWQISDPQIIDEESPCRMEGVTYAPYVTASAYRPQGIFSTHMFDLHVQTARRISDISSRPFDFALVTGDIADNAQVNENAWFLRMMGGGVLNPDTGIDDDPVPGPNNDFNDPFYSNGLGNIPWYPAIGNHDMLYMGFTPFDDKIQAACTGDTVVDLFDYVPIIAEHHYRDGYQNGFQDGASPDAAIVTTGTTPADPDRRLMTKAETLQKFYDAPGFPIGHGLDPEIMAKGWGYYSTYPIPDRPIRLISLDTNSGQFSEANMTAEQFEWVKNQIADAKSKNELVILQSHHGTDKFGGEVSQTRFQELLASYGGVVLHITGHGHNNDSTLYVQGHRGYWEVMLASVVDYPSQTRVFEIVHEGQGYISIYITNLDPNAPVGSFVDLGMSYAAARRFFGMSDDAIADWNIDKEHRNLILRTKIPEAVYQNLEQYEWSEVVESVETLEKLSFKPTVTRW